MTEPTPDFVRTFKCRRSIMAPNAKFTMGKIYTYVTETEPMGAHNISYYVLIDDLGREATVPRDFFREIK